MPMRGNRLPDHSDGGDHGSGSARPGRSGTHPGRPGVAQLDPADAAQLRNHPVTLRRIGALFAPFRGRLAVVVALIVASSVLGLATPFLTKHVIDDAIVGQDVPLLLILVGAMLAVTVITAVLGVLQTWLATTTGQQVMHRLRSEVFSHLQRQSLDFFTRTRGGEVQSRLTQDISGMQSVVTTTATSIASNVTVAVGTVIAMVALSWQLSLLSLLVLPPAIWLTRKVALMRRAVTAKRQRALADLHAQVEESLSISGVILARTMGTGPLLRQRFTGTSANLVELEVAAELAGRWRMATMSVIFAAIPALIYLAAGLPVTGAGLSIGTLVAFIALQHSLFRPLMGVLNVGVQVISSMALFSRIFEYLDLPVTVADPEHPVPLPAGGAVGHVRLEHVGYTYPGADRPALDGIDLTIEPGRTLALVGSSGAGKSTLAALVARLMDTGTGRVLIDGVDVRERTLADLAAVVGVVSQETYLLHTTIAENLRYARPGADDAQIVAAAKAAQIHELILSLPDGYDTVVGARGHRFSGGEKQRLAIARTILRDPKVLILDEATSALDNQTETAVQEALTELSRGRTTITIAHRLSTVRGAEAIAVLDRGRLVELGSHDDLLATGGRYADLVAGQHLTVAA